MKGLNLKKHSKSVCRCFKKVIFLLVSYYFFHIKCFHLWFSGLCFWCPCPVLFNQSRFSSLVLVLLVIFSCLTICHSVTICRFTYLDVWFYVIAFTKAANWTGINWIKMNSNITGLCKWIIICLNWIILSVIGLNWTLMGFFALSAESTELTFTQDWGKKRKNFN